MSLVSFAMRIATVRVIRAALPEAFAVIDSPQEPLDRLEGDNPLPFVAIYTGHIETNTTGRSLLGGSSNIELSIQIVLPSQVTFMAGGHTVMLDTRKQGAETALDVLWRRVANALVSSADPWAEIWRNIVLQTSKVTNNSYLIERAAVRATAREVVLTCDPIHEPLPGGAPSGVWASLITLMRAETGQERLSDFADWLEAEISGEATLEQSMRDAAYLGLSGYAASAVGIGGFAGDINNSTGTAVIEEPVPPAP